jgi:hypothetical protein
LITRGGTFLFFPTLSSEFGLQEARCMGRRWTEQDVSELRHLAQRYSAPRIAELTDRTVGGVAFKAYQLKLPLRSNRRGNEQNAGADLDARASPTE